MLYFFSIADLVPSFGFISVFRSENHPKSYFTHFEFVSFSNSLEFPSTPRSPRRPKSSLISLRLFYTSLCDSALSVRLPSTLPMYVLVIFIYPIFPREISSHSVVCSENIAHLAYCNSDALSSTRVTLECRHRSEEKNRIPRSRIS